MSTIKTNQITHLTNSGTANLQLDSSGNTTVADLTANAVTAQSVTLSNNLTVNGNTTIGNSDSDSVTFNATVTGSSFEAGIIGEIRMWSTLTAPNGWLLCNGSTIGNTGSGATNESASYAALFDLIKGTSGAGLYGNVGTESFISGDTVKLPDFRGRMPIGVGQQSNTKYNSSSDNYTTSGTNFAISATGGTEDHKITVNELAQHNHTTTLGTGTATISDPGHRHSVQKSQLAHNHSISPNPHTHAYTDPTDTTSSGEYGLEEDGYGNTSDVVPTNASSTTSTSLSIGSTTPNINETTSTASGVAPFIDSATTGITDSGHTHSLTVNNTGDSTNNPASILNPYLAINFIIKV